MVDFPKIERDILAYWDTIKAFETSLARARAKKYPQYTFYDGPPFATGLPHYGHILASVIKDVVPRYMTQTGKYVPRRWGWDTHGVPIEFEIEKKLGIKTKEDIENMGIKEYCGECRSVVLTYADEWKKTVTRLGRWVDMKGAYMTMDSSYMQSVWWVFKTLYEKGLIYTQYKVLPYSSACATPLSNFESSENYQSVTDPSLYLSFKLENGKYALVWTTTPWTLPSNLALCVNASAQYCDFTKDGVTYVVCEATLGSVPNAADVVVVNRYMGSELVGLKYEPLFGFYRDTHSGAFRVVADNYVTTTTGTGIVHQAPAFGVDDYRVCIESGITHKGVHPPCPFDEHCRFTSEVKDELPEIQSMDFRGANKPIIANLKSRGHVYHAGTITHDYPFCWRSDTPLMYRAVPAWFVNVNTLRDDMLSVLDSTYWVPEHVKTNRFANWIKGNGTESVDWCVSRNRYWGTPIPVWTNGEERVVIGSTEELEKLAGLEPGIVTDLHRSNVDDIEIPSKLGGAPLRRIKEVCDCWFESGCMPVASIGYPATKPTASSIAAMPPANFIAEGLDQTRGWFYTLTVISTALFGKPAFQNVIVNGLVLAEDGKKMSKRKQNYPPPDDIIDEFGADALRLYLTQSKAVQAEELRFKKAGVKQMVQTILLPLHFSLNLLNESAPVGFKPLPLSLTKHTFDNVLDNWILQLLDQLLKKYHADMSSYKLQHIVDYFGSFIDSLSRWYINLNKSRIKSGDRHALSALFHCLNNVSQLLAPFAPFYAEHLYQQLTNYMTSEAEKSVHWCQLPQKVWHINDEFLMTVKDLFTVLDGIRALRDQNALSFKRPLKHATIAAADPDRLSKVAGIDYYIRENCNVLGLTYDSNMNKYVKTESALNLKTVGQKYGKKLPLIKRMFSSDSPVPFKVDDDITLTSDDVVVKTELLSTSTSGTALIAGDFVIVIDTNTDQTIEFQHEARKLVAFINKMRSDANLRPRDHMNVHYRLLDCKNPTDLDNAITLLIRDQDKYVLPQLKYSIYPYDACKKYFYTDDTTVFGITVQIQFEEIPHLFPVRDEEEALN